jgi:hypothetical protein
MILAAHIILDEQGKKKKKDIQIPFNKAMTSLYNVIW